MSEKVLDVAAVRKQFQDTLTEAMLRKAQEFNPDAMLKSIIADAVKQKEKLTLELLGVANKWGKYEIDHCNGRVGTIDKAMIEKFKELVDPIVEEEIRNVIGSATKNKNHPIRVAVRTAIKTNLSAAGYTRNDLVQQAVKGLLNEIVTSEMEAVRKSLLSDTP